MHRVILGRAQELRCISHLQRTAGVLCPAPRLGRAQREGAREQGPVSVTEGWVSHTAPQEPP